MKKILLILICASALLAQTHNVNSDTSIASINGVDTANIASINGVTWLGYGAGGGGGCTAEIVCDDFETGATSTSWTSETSTGTNAITVQTDSVYAGTYAARYTFDGTNEENYLEISVADATKIYISLQANYNTTFCGGSAWVTTPIISLMDGAVEVCRLQVQANGTGTAINNLSLVGEGVGSPVYFGTDPNFYANDWQRIELIYRKGTGGDGTGHFVFFWEAPGISHSDSMTTITDANNLIDAIRIGGWDAGSTTIQATGILYLDDIVVDSTDNHVY